MITIFRLFATVFCPRILLLLKKILRASIVKFFPKFPFRSSHTSEAISTEMEDFVHINTPQWDDMKSTSSPDGYILIDGLLSNSGLNYLLRTGIVAKAIEEETGCIPVVFVKNKNNEIRAGYTSFNINEYLFLPNDIISIWNYIKATVFTWLFTLKGATGDRLLQIKCNSILLGDLIYDEILHSEKYCYTLGKSEKLTVRQLSYVSEAYFTLFEYKRIFAKFPFRYMVTTHTAYITYGLMARIAAFSKIPVFETTDRAALHLFKCNNDGTCIPYLLNGARESILMHMPDLPQDIREIKRTAKALLSNYFSGDSTRPEVGLAFGKRKINSITKLEKFLNLDKGKKNILIFAHVFTDAPHVSSSMLFNDYYDWLYSTLEVASGMPSVNWLVKPHPSSRYYQLDDGIIEQLARRIIRGSGIVYLPDQISTASILEMADGIVTCSGSIGLEASCVGLPVLMAGNSFYSGFGFCMEPTTREDYFTTLRNMPSFKRIEEPQILEAMKIFLAWDYVHDPVREIIPSEALLHLWGCNENGINIELGNKIILNRLKELALRKTTFYNEAKRGYAWVS